MIGRWIEAAIFTALAIALHLAILLAQPADTGQMAGGAGGGSSVTMAGANTAMTEMIAEWDDAPFPHQTIDKMMSEQPDQPTDVATDMMSPPVMAPPVETQDAPAAAQAVTVLTDARIVKTSPNPAPRMQPTTPSDAPGIPTPVTPLAGLAMPIVQPAPASPPPDATAPQIETALVEAPEPAVATNAPTAAPPPQKRPRPPKRKIAKVAPTKPKTTQKPKAAAKEPLKAAAFDARNGASPEAAPATRAAGAGGGAEAGDGQAHENTEGDTVRVANLIRQWGSKIRRGVERKKRSPRNLRRTGTTQVAMTIAHSGALMAASISKSSGQSKLDKAAMRAVKSAAPYVPAPAELGGKSQRFVLNIRFEK